MASVATTLKLDIAIQERVQRLADTQRRPAGLVMREAIGQYLDREEQREQLRKDASSAWDHYQETGLHATAREADEWMRKLSSGKKARKPQCHV